MNVLLNVILFLPVAAALLLLLVPRQRPAAVRVLALIASLLVLALSVALALRFSPGEDGMQFATNAAWISSPSIRYHIGVDGISLFLVVLIAFLSVLSVLVSWRSVQEHYKEFFFFLLLLETGTIGVFVSVDLFSSMCSGKRRWCPCIS